MSLLARALRFGHARGPQLGPLDLELRPGELLGLVGPNGAGKSTLMRTLARAIPSLGGELLLEGHPFPSYEPRAWARALAFLPQQLPEDGQWKASAIVALGRTPHQPGWRLSPDARDREAIERAVGWAEVGELLHKPMQRMSGGERQRVHLARVLAQEAPFLLLDEPTAHLDLRHQGALFSALHAAREQHPLAAMVALHDLNLAARCCDRLILLTGGQVLASGTPSQVLKRELLEAAYACPVRLEDRGPNELPLVLPWCPEKRI